MAEEASKGSHNMISSEGYLYVPQCIEDKDLHALRAEADSLFGLKRLKSALSEDEYFDKVSGFKFDTQPTRSVAVTASHHPTIAPLSQQ